MKASAFRFIVPFMLYLIFGVMHPVQSQVAVSTTNSAAHSSAMMDVQSNTMGVLMPRMTAAERQAIAAPATGLLVFQTDIPSGFYYFNGSQWQKLQEAVVEADPIYTAWDKSTGITIPSTKISNFSPSVASVQAVADNTAKRSYPGADAAKLSGIQAGAEVNVNADWNATSGDAFILNKTPVTPGMALITPAVAGNFYYFEGGNWVAKSAYAGLSSGGNQPINNMQPTLTLSFAIALQGIFPSQNAIYPFLAEIMITSFNFAPQGWALCNGQLLPINQNQALFSLLGTMYGGNGQTNFALPDFRGRVPVSRGNTLTQGQMLGTETITLNASQVPVHTHVVTYQ